MSPLYLITLLLGALRLTVANVHPITIHGHYFVNSVTKEPVCVATTSEQHCMIDYILTVYVSST